MQRTIADELRDEGRKMGRKEGELRARRTLLLRLLRRRFGEIPDELTRKVKQTNDLAQLDGWLDQVVDAASLDDMGIC